MCTKTNKIKKKVIRNCSFDMIQCHLIILIICMEILIIFAFFSEMAKLICGDCVHSSTFITLNKSYRISVLISFIDVLNGNFSDRFTKAINLSRLDHVELMYLFHRR